MNILGSFKFINWRCFDRNFGWNSEEVVEHGLFLRVFNCKPIFFYRNIFEANFEPLTTFFIVIHVYSW